MSFVRTAFRISVSLLVLGLVPALFGGCDDGPRATITGTVELRPNAFVFSKIAVGEEGEELLAHPHRKVRRLVERVAAEVEEGMAVGRLAGEVRARHHVRPRLVDG